MCAFQCLTLSLSGPAGLALNFLLECVFITPSEQCTPPHSDSLSASHSSFCSCLPWVNILLPFSLPSFVCVTLSSMSKANSSWSSVCVCVSPCRPSVCQRMIPGLYILTLCSSNCCQATPHNIDQCVWSVGYWWIWNLVSNDVLHFFCIIYTLVSRKLTIIGVRVGKCLPHLCVLFQYLCAMGSCAVSCADFPSSFPVLYQLACLFIFFIPLPIISQYWCPYESPSAVNEFDE